MTHEDLIHDCWEQGTAPSASVFKNILDNLDEGKLCVVSKKDNGWHVNAWIKKAILLYFRHHKSTCMNTGGQAFYDKIPLKCEGWDEQRFEAAGFRMTPGATVRRGAFVAPSCVVMPSFINIGAFVDEGTMIDNMAYVGSCAFVGKRCHISGSAGLGGVLEPIQGTPVIVEDDCFVGAGCQIVEGVRIGHGSVIGMGTTLGQSTKIIDRRTGKRYQGEVPPYSVVVPGSYTDSHQPGLALHCAVIVKTVDAQVRAKTAVNELLRT
ncbi:2,3,4,5-tetrahydropyridine-2,6-dicarboxylate N-succinyltransferase [Candidatus Hepatobacter penaei]|uniref:2,3,4,5-tetrahydropyridine-2,6-dicarboxylate N-succinyltransferase n=1 Tax=Candidatus Hepatobacter penaei TaxID=1274402 RepID=UPI0004F3013D|nr:2,3,4,5-tetrahydropyridine-2,6-dicarboxylate N-succinyltransferase [Candidatus Hepatobacter penaei]